MTEMITGFPTLTTDALIDLVRDHAHDKRRYGRKVPRYLSLAFCNVLTVQAYAEVQGALQAKRWIDRLACGHCCQRWHTILDLETRQYVTASIFDLFTQLYPPLVNVTARTSPLIQPIGRRRRILFPGVGERGPWLHYTPGRTSWHFEFHAGTYRLYQAWESRLEELGLGTLLDWMFYEVAHTVPRAQGNRMMLAGGEVWVHCPTTFARTLVGSLHAFLVGITRKCERGKARAVYYDAHPELPKWHTINGGELARMPAALLEHDFWCGLRNGEADCSCTWPVEHSDVTAQL